MKTGQKISKDKSLHELSTLSNDFCGKKKHTPSVSSLRESSHVKSGEDTVLSSELIHRRQVRVVRGVDFRITELESALSLFAGWPLVPGQVTSSLVPI